MIFKQKGMIRDIILVLDLFCAIVSCVFAALIRQGIFHPRFFHSIYGVAFFVILMACLIVSILTEKEEAFFRRGFAVEFRHVVKGRAMIASILVLFLFVTQQGGKYSRLFFCTFFVLDVCFVYVLRCYLKIIMLTVYRNSIHSTKVILVTTRDMVDETVRRIRAERLWHVELDSVFVVDEGMTGRRIENGKWSNDLPNIYEYARLAAVDEVLIQIPPGISSDVSDLILTFEKMGVVVHLCLNVRPELNLVQKKVGKFGGYHVVSFSTNIFGRQQIVMKRVMDIAGGLFGVVVTGALMVLLAPVICLESPGPVLFSQTRVGQNGRRFKMYKFRSMCVDAEDQKAGLVNQNEMSGFMFKMENDPRVTRVGRFLRRTSLDEFPQFWNVLKGEMSLVGTRPPTVDEFEQYAPEYKRRVSIKPGLTGLWQVSGRSDITDFDKVVQLDLQYIDHWSLGQDVKIILKTFTGLLFGRGAK